jgi:DNA adenine methylase
MDTMKTTITKPFLKWVGGKTQMINTLMSKFPKEINNYHELFIGGGSVLFAVLSFIKQKKIKIKGKVYAYDINTSLINVYKQIQSNPEKVLEYIEIFKKEYSSISEMNGERKVTTKEEALLSKESYYYWQRNNYNKTEPTSTLSAALFIFLNKTCFRGMFREGPNGFNVPFGHYKTTPSFITKDNIIKIKNLIQKVEFINCSFTDSIKKPIQGDFVYMDPPYAPETKTSFVGYTKKGFNTDMHKALFKNIKILHQKQIKLMMSNSKVTLVMDAFKDKSFHKEDILARRAINSKNPSAKTTEILIYN